MTLTTLPKYGINPPPTDEELKRAKELVKKGKIKAKLNRPKNAEEAWENMEKAINDIREDFLSQK
jgi:ribulose kinase